MFHMCNPSVSLFTFLVSIKALHQLSAFAALTNAEVDTIIDVMDHIVRYKGDLIC